MFFSRKKEVKKPIESSMGVISTIPPYAPYIEDVANHPIITGIRFNTVMPITKEPLENILSSIKRKMNGKTVWVDLKCRQIRISHGAFYKSPVGIRMYEINGEKIVLDPSNPKTTSELKTPPWAEIKIDHKIKLDLKKPVKAWFGDGHDCAYIVQIVDGDTLIMLDGPRKVVGGGESINIIDPSLEIEGFFTDLDYKYIEACKKVGIHTYMLSYVEKDSDLEELIKLDPLADIRLKIESQKGIDWVNKSYEKICSKYRNSIHLMPARGDMYNELGMYRPEKIIKPLARLIKQDPSAIVASRILTSLVESPRPQCADITDVVCLLGMGYRNFMLGDDICFNKDSLMLALDMLKAIDNEYSSI